MITLTTARATPLSFSYAQLIAAASEFHSLSQRPYRSRVCIISQESRRVLSPARGQALTSRSRPIPISSLLLDAAVNRPALRDTAGCFTLPLGCGLSTVLGIIHRLSISRLDLDSPHKKFHTSDVSSRAIPRLNSSATGSYGVVYS